LTRAAARELVRLADILVHQSPKAAE
jgi:hypothetical protein